MIEQTVVLIKPEGVKRALVGKIIDRLESLSLKIVAMKMVWAEKETVGEHYSNDDTYCRKVGENTLKFYTEHGQDANEKLGTMDPLEIGRLVRGWNMDSLSSGPIIAMIWEGPHAVEIVRKVVGTTNPQVSPAGTIRGDYTIDSYTLANTQKRTIKTIIHASGSPTEAEFERQLWFHEKEVHSNYKRVDQDLVWGE
jgi:nucleoside-diphosphate kinase